MSFSQRPGYSWLSQTPVVSQWYALADSVVQEIALTNKASAIPDAAFVFHSDVFYTVSAMDAFDMEW